MTDNSKSLTTTQAAKLLAVSPDTVLKWAKAGKIESFRTIGGHYRIPRSAVEGTSPVGMAATPDLSKAPQTYQYCWEYLARGGEISPDCKDCITFRSRSKRCYELRDLPNGLGCLRVYCKSNCDECDYYHMMQGTGYNVLVLSEQERILRDREQLEEENGVAVEFASNEYQCSLLIDQFRPDFVVVDCSLGEKRTSTVCSALFNDQRIPVPRIILASKTKKLKDYCDREVFGWIAKPFSIQQLVDCITGVGERKA